MAVVLHDYWRSSASYRVRIALAIKDIAYETVPVAMLAGEHASDSYRSRNPQGLVPTLEIDGAILTQSLAIIDYLDAIAPVPRLIPLEPLARARTLSLALAIVADIHPIDNLRVLKRLESQFGADQAAKDTWYVHWIAEGFAALEALVGERPFLGGDAPDLADVCLVPQIYNARRFAVSLDAYPKLVRIDAAASALTAFKSAHPDLFRPT